MSNSSLPTALVRFEAVGVIISERRCFCWGACYTISALTDRRSDEHVLSACFLILERGFKAGARVLD